MPPLHPGLLPASSLGLIGCLLACAAFLRLAPRLGLLDRLAGIPRIGGLAVAVGLTLAAIVLPDARLTPLLVPTAGALLLGLHDDLTDSPARVRLVALIGLASLAWLLGARVESLSLAGLDSPIPLGLLSAPVTVLAIVAVVVGYDFIDGLDGLAPSLGALAAVALILAGAPPLMLGALAAGLIGFALAFNRPPARAWLGDAGSNATGMLLATAAASLPGPLPVLSVLLIFAVPLLDATLTVVRRAAQSDLFAGEQGHLHHRLAALWRAPLPAVLELVSVSALCAAAGLSLIHAPQHGPSALLGAALALGILLWRTGWLRRRP